MARVTFIIIINALPNQVYDAMIQSQHVDRWISVFSPREVWHEGSWAEGDQVTFYTYDEKRIAQGMLCNIAINKPNEHVFVQPIGVVQNTKQIIQGDAVKDLEKTYEEYIFTRQGEQTKLTVNAAVYPNLKKFFEETWPKSLEVIKQTAEGNY